MKTDPMLLPMFLYCCYVRIPKGMKIRDAYFDEHDAIESYVRKRGRIPQKAFLLKLRHDDESNMWAVFKTKKIDSEYIKRIINNANRGDIDEDQERLRVHGCQEA